MSGTGKDGAPTAINFVTITPAEASALPGFRRFCTPEDVRRASTPAESWGEWLTDKLRRIPEAIGAVERRPAALRTFAAAPGTPFTTTGAAARPAAPPPVSETLRSPDGALVAIVPAWQVPARLAQGWTRV